MESRERIYRIVKVFISESPSVIADINDMMYTKLGDNNFYIEKADGRIYQLDWSLGMKAVRYGWVELVKVENSTGHG